jgi:two-component system NarL family sensor kinase
MPHDRISSRASGNTLESPDPASEPDEPRLAHLLVDQSDEFVLWIDAEAHLLYGNPAICRALGYSQAEFSTLHLSDISFRTPESWPGLWQELKQNLSQNFAAELHSRNGGIIPVHFSANYIGGKEFVLCRGQDLRESHSKPQPIFVMPKQQGPDVEGEAVELFGGSRQQIIDELQSLLREPGDATTRALAGDEVTFDWHSRRPDGSSVNIECTLSRIEIEGEVRLLAVAVDLTARRQSEQTLARLSGRLLQMQDEERRRIAHELHDTTGQNLSALSISLSTVLSNTRLDPRTRQTIKESLALADGCIREIRTMSYLLHPPLLDELGLVSAIRAYSEGYSQRTGIPLELLLPSYMPRLPQAVETALFRIMQEGLTNVHRHAGSQKGTLGLKYEHDRVELELVDYGRGLAPSASRIGVGIAGMRERAHQLGGRLTIASGQTGTTLRVVLPILHTQQLDASVGRS